MPRFVDLTGRTFGRLEVLRDAGSSRRGRLWRCLCTCGNEATVCALELNNGDTKSCGCLRRELRSARRRTHGGSDSPEYQLWRGILRRCEEPGNKDYPRYGGRGITVCARWHDFAHFIADMGTRPSPELSVDRIDPNGNYEPSNCRWATIAEQGNNRRDAVVFRGQKTSVLALAKRFNISQQTLWHRIHKQGKSPEQAVGV